MGLQGYVGSAADQARIRRLEKEREEDRQRIDNAKKAASSKPYGFRTWERSTVEVVENAFKKETVGLVTREEYIEKKSTMQTRLEEEDNKRKREDEAEQERHTALSKAVKGKERRNAKLSFLDDDNDDEDDIMVLAQAVHARQAGTAPIGGTPSTSANLTIRKNDEVATGFLPDAKRQRAMEDMRIKLKKEWLHEQARLKEAPLAVKFSYWDGSGHQREVSVLIGDTVGAFIKQARLALEKDFPQLRHVTVPNLLLVKDDIMLPQAMSFYTLIVSKAHNGRSQLLFDVDSPAGAQKVHSAKVVQRSWYESNKHIYPANRWELFDEHAHVSK